MFEVSNHAVERYRERIDPCRNHDDHELKQFIKHYVCARTMDAFEKMGDGIYKIGGLCSLVIQNNIVVTVY